jgi:ubiquinone/menaquinone biosynthesis C-methylase UbiE
MSYSKLLQQKEWWDNKWKSIFESYQHDLRVGHYINALRNDNETNILELGAGSFRDTNQLSKFGLQVNANDFSQTSVDLAKTTFPLLKDKIKQMDAFNLSYSDKSFDLSFHNGLWVYYNEEEIDRLLKEQIRVTKHRVITIVHNDHNISFKEYFRTKIETGDDLFNIKFYQVDEIKRILEKQCKNVIVIPIGKAYSAYEDLLIKDYISKGETYTNKEELKNMLLEPGLKYLESSERLLCIGEINNE